MHEFILSIVFLSIGSFSSVLIYRLPLMESGNKEFNLFYPRSHCPKCKHTLLNKSLIPLIGYLLNYGNRASDQTPPIPSTYSILLV